VGSDKFGDHPTFSPSYTSSHNTNPTIESTTAIAEQFLTVLQAQQAPVELKSPFPSPFPLPTQLVAPLDVAFPEMPNSPVSEDCKNPFKRNSTGQQLSANTQTFGIDWDNIFDPDC
jgi:hypothetical protein